MDVVLELKRSVSKQFSLDSLRKSGKNFSHGRQSSFEPSRDLGIGIVPYSPLGRGFFAGKAIVENLQEGDSRLVRNPRFHGENIEKNKVLFERVSALAKKHGYTPAQLALAWVLHQGSDVAPIPGTSKIKNLDENIASLWVSLSQPELNEIAAAVPEHEVAGLRYADSIYQTTWKFANTPQPK